MRGLEMWWISRSNCVGMVSDISATSYYKILRNESHIMVYFNGIVPLVIYCLFNVNTLTWPVDMPSWGSLAYSIVFATIFGLAMWYVGISQIGSTKVMVYMYLVPLFAVIFAAVTIGEQINMMQLVGGLIIFIGLYVVKRWNQKPALNLKKVS